MMLMMTACMHTHMTLSDAESETNSNTDKIMLSTIVNWSDCYN